MDWIAELFIINFIKFVLLCCNLGIAPTLTIELVIQQTDRITSTIWKNVGRSSLYRIQLDCGHFVPQSNRMWHNKIIRVLYVIRENPRFRQQVSTKTLHTLRY